jgi:hypothetical protein
VSESLLAPVVKRFHVSVGISYINGYTPLTIPGDRTRNGPDCWWIDCVIVRSCVRFVRITIGCVWVAKALDRSFDSIPVHSLGTADPLEAASDGEGRLLFVTGFRGEIGFAIFPLASLI